MRITLVGYGRMGPEVRSVAEARGHEIGRVFDVDRPPSLEAGPEADVVIDFSTAAAVPATLDWVARWRVPLVEGTTGWYDQLDSAMRLPGLTMVYSPNFSPGVYLFARLAGLAAGLFSNTGDYDAYVHEWHHAGKADSPSGTAGRLAEVLLERLPHKDSAWTETSHGKIDPRRLHVTSTRAGHFPGTHEVGFSSRWDTVTLRHQAGGREAFAYGAVLAAEWIKGRAGIFTMDDFMSDLGKLQGKE
jgi:4-hydroxy-tetrahydrodipicolinate reductase